MSLYDDILYLTLLVASIGAGKVLGPGPTSGAWPSTLFGLAIVVAVSGWHALHCVVSVALRRSVRRRCIGEVACVARVRRRRVAAAGCLEERRQEEEQRRGAVREHQRSHGLPPKVGQETKKTWCSHQVLPGALGNGVIGPSQSALVYSFLC